MLTQALQTLKKTSWIAQIKPCKVGEGMLPPLRGEQVGAQLIGEAMADEPCWHPAHDGVGFDIARHHRPCGHHRSGADADAGAQAGILPDPHVMADEDMRIAGLLAGHARPVLPPPSSARAVRQKGR